MLTKEHFIKAADLIEERGLARSAYYDKDLDCMCTVSALYYVAGAGRPNDPRYGEIIELSGNFRPVIEHKYGWNGIVADWDVQELERTFTAFVFEGSEGYSRYDIEMWSDRSTKEEVVVKLREFAETLPDESTSEGGPTS
jgi:hypothetical protein